MTNCLVCQSACTRFSKVDGYQFFACTGCGLLQIDPAVISRIDSGETVFAYDATYWDKEMESARERAFGIALARAAEVFLCSRREILRFLDIGTGPGTFLDAVAIHLPQISDRFHGVELFPPQEKDRSQHANYRIGHVRDYAPGSIDGGMCIEVLEHLTPRQATGLLAGIAAAGSDGSCFLINTGLADYTRTECPEYLDPAGRGHITSWTVAAVNQLAAPYGLVASAIPGRNWCFLLEKASAPRPSIEERAASPLPENLAALHGAQAPASPVALLGRTALREAHYYDQFLSRTQWAMALQEELQKRAVVPGARSVRRLLRRVPGSRRARDTLRRLGGRLGQQRAHKPPAPLAAYPPERYFRLRSHAEWAALVQKQPEDFSPGRSRQILNCALALGISSRFLGAIDPNEIQMVGDEPREGLLARGFNPRQRAALDIFAADARAQDVHTCRIYAHEGITNFALLLRGRYPRFVGSEFAADETAAAQIWPIPSIDIAHSGFPAGSFDFVLSNEVLEHVPDLDAALLDTARILKPGGRFVATFPFHWDSDETLIRAKLAGGVVEHLLPPEYHGNPIDPEGGSLVFQIPGWDILQRCRQAGFADAVMSFYSSGPAGITSRDLPGIFVLEAER
jgi:2-polyprenyl-3-methyl-5-hydroxy-6-metoxy-1,4-benzoquinol methylase